jgi:hypothetical protein
VRDLQRLVADSNPYPPLILNVVHIQLWAETRNSETAAHWIHQVFMAKTARVPVLSIHEPARNIPVGFW